ncbi:hypothetical protein DL768_008064 [Monosporascus sp. mg162]|nr:hypothetical protein DL768_008064 [Monosporascus sp. mg162]
MAAVALAPTTTAPVLRSIPATRHQPTITSAQTPACAIFIALSCTTMMVARMTVITARTQAIRMHSDGQYGHGNSTIADTAIRQNPALTHGPLPFFPLAGAEAGVPGSASGREKVQGEVGEDKAGRPS